MDYIKLYTLRLDTKRQFRANRSNLLSTKFNRITHITRLGHQLQSFVLKRSLLLHYIRDISHFISEYLKTRIAQWFQLKRQLNKTKQKKKKKIYIYIYMFCAVLEYGQF